MNEYILSIDPSLTSTGWAVIDKTTREVIDVDKICTTSKTDEDDRMMYIVCSLLDIRRKYSISQVALENSFLGVNAKTGMLLSKLRGAIMVGFRLTNSKIGYMMPSSIRMHLMGKGNGGADKVAVADEIVRLYPNNQKIIDLGPFTDKQNKKKNSDMYDAVSIGLASIIEEDNRGVI